MGAWGMGIAQSDEYCEVYENFMKQYGDGAEVSAITSNILAEYYKEFDENDEVMHDVYFALAKAEWMCCAQSEEILVKVKEIIETDANIVFYRELEATEPHLKLRRKNLQKFWETLQTPRSKPRKRIKDTSDKVKEFPPVQTGECYSYKFNDGYRVTVILDRYKSPVMQEQVCCCILNKTFSSLDIDVMNEEIGYVAKYIGLDFIAKSKLRKLTSIALPKDLRKHIDKRQIWSLGSKDSFTRDTFPSLKVTISDLINNVD